MTVATEGRPVADALLAALDRAAAPVRLFVRDDDAGWADDRLFALLDTMDAAEVPIDLAAIPAALADDTAAALRRRMELQPLGVHQHGFAHTNHETEGRKCEFGAARPAAARLDDLRNGRQRLLAQFDGRLDAIFTPPWNRCTADTPAQLAALGVSALSRDRGAPAQSALAEIPIHVDWSRQWREATADGSDPAARIAAAMAAPVRAGETAVGLMLHHAVTADDELAVLRRLLRTWRAHPRARWCAMRSLLPGAAA